MQTIFKKKKSYVMLFTFAFLICSCKNSIIYFDEKEVIRLLTIDNVPEINYQKNSAGELVGITSRYFDDVFKTQLIYREIDGVRRVKNIVAYYRDSVNFGHNFNFYNNGKLANYGFNTGHGKLSPYVVNFGYEGVEVQTLGTPLVYHQFKEKEVQLFFSKILFDSLRAQVKLKNRSFKEIKLKRATVQPGVLEAFLPIDKQNMIIRIFGYKGDIKREYRDTLTFDK